MVVFISAGCVLVLLLIAAILAFRVPVSSASVNTISKTIVNTAIVATVTVLTFPKAALQKYAERMATAQPIFNDRLLEGEGKTHTLNALASAVSSDDCSVISVLQQVGDTFS